MPTDTIQASILRRDLGQRAASWGKFLIVALVAAILGSLLLIQFGGINSTEFHTWMFRTVTWWRIYPAMALAATPFFLSQVMLARAPAKARPKTAIACMMASTLIMQLVAVGAQPNRFDLGHIVNLVEDKMATSYFTDAQLVASQPSVKPFLKNYASFLEFATFHSREKPPGPVLYYVMCIRLLGEPGLAALAGAMGIGVVSTLSIPAAYLLARLLTNGNQRAALCAAAYLTLSPCLVLIYPMFDQIYAVFTCAMVCLWVIAIRDNRYWASAAFGAVLAAAIFFSYTHLVLGAFIVLYAILQLAPQRLRGGIRFLLHSQLALGVVASAYLLLWLATGFDPIAAFMQALKNQAALLANLKVPRPYPAHVPGDLLDFLLGSGWISLPLILFWCVGQRAGNPQREDPIVRRNVLLGLAQILIVALTGLLPGETARVWMFLQPLAMLPIGLELARWDPWPRLGVYVILFLLTSAMGQNLTFVMIE